MSETEELAGESGREDIAAADDEAVESAVFEAASRAYDQLRSRPATHAAALGDARREGTGVARSLNAAADRPAVLRALERFAREAGLRNAEQEARLVRAAINRTSPVAIDAVTKARGAVSDLRAEGYGAQADAVEMALLRAAMRAVVHMSDDARVRHFAWAASGMTTRDP